MSYGEVPDKVLESTCSCGAKFKVVAQYPLRYYAKWLEQHKDHMGAQPSKEADGEHHNNN